MDTLVRILFSHFLGDHIPMRDADGWWGVLVRAVLYCLPYRILLGLDLRMALVFIVHIATDILSDRLGAWWTRGIRLAAATAWLF